MSFEVGQSNQFKVNELSLVTKAGKIDISGIYEELNLYDSLFLPVMSGNVLIKDSLGLSGKIFFDGSESILIDISKSKDSDIGAFRKSFRIFKQSERENQTMNSEMYMLHFVSDELMYSDQQRINQGFESTYSTIVERILENYLKVPRNSSQGIYDVTSGICKVVIPNLRPLEAIEWCAKRAVDKKNSPNYVFYQNAVGYNFASLSNLLTKPEILDIKFEPKNLKDSNAIEEISSARALEVISQNDSIEKTRSGVNSGRFIGFDPLTRFTASKKISYGDHYSSMKHSNETPSVSVVPNRDGVSNLEMYDSKKTLSVFSASRRYSNYIKKNDPSSLSKDEPLEQIIFQRNAIIKNLMQKRVKLTMPGNFQLTSGFNVNLKAPNFGLKEKGGENEDLSISGKYIIIATRHMIGFDKHQTIIEIATTSSGNDFIPAGSYSQTAEIASY